MRFKKTCGIITAAVMCFSACIPTFAGNKNFEITASADEWYFAGSTCEPLHDTSRDIQKEGVGNPLNFGERNTPADASTAEIRAINHKMSVQEVKYALYKEIDEHWDLISKRFGQTDRKKMYALFLGLGSRESTLGEGKIGLFDTEQAGQKGSRQAGQKITAGLHTHHDAAELVTEAVLRPDQGQDRSYEQQIDSHGCLIEVHAVQQISVLPVLHSSPHCTCLCTDA